MTQKTFSIELLLPVRFDILVEEADTDTGYKIKDVRIAHGQTKFTEHDLMEHCDEETWAVLDSCARKALGLPEAP